MNRDINGLLLAQRMGRAQRLLVDTYSGVILGYADTNGKTGELRPKVYEAIAGSRVAILTIGEYLRMTINDDNRREEQERHITAGEWYRSLDVRFEGFMESIRENTNIKKIQ